MIDVQSIRDANPLPNVVGAQIKLQRAGSEWKACCPFHADRSPSFTIFKGGERFHCFGCGASGDVLDYVRRLHTVGLVEAAQMLGAGDLPRVVLPKVPPTADRNRIGEAKAIWESAVPATGTLAETYLQSRGITVTLPRDIRFAWLPIGSSPLMPCMIVGLRSAQNKMTGIQRIYLREDGSGKADILKPKLSLGGIAGSAFRVGHPNPGDVLTVCEGPEDGLSLMQMFGIPVWVAAGASMMPKMQFPASIRRIAIAADNDATGQKKADEAAAVFAARGLKCRIIRPKPGFKDWNHELKGRANERR